MTMIDVGSTERDAALVRALRARDETAFAALLDAYQASLLRVAMIYVGNRAVAEEVVQETWLGVIRGIDRFEGRSSLKTWIYRILNNIAKTRAEREGRTVPLSALATVDEDGEPSVEIDRFFDASHPTWAGHWIAYPSTWDDVPERRLLSSELRARLEGAIEALPPSQRLVVRLRDVEGFPPEEVCELLGISEGNQRVLLHRGRAKLRAALERYFEEGEAA